ncbi:hypothetical protein ACDQ55_20980 [Chitinophaga sp. 30R24]|uniref:hypothetical protein n=1 Tax=Chitinophaga sp. 30R24 TaxID=3248838 RepID=UPI003B9198BC
MEKKPKFTFDAESKALLSDAAQSLKDNDLDLFKTIMDESLSAASTRPFPEGTFVKNVPTPRRTAE